MKNKLLVMCLIGILFMNESNKLYSIQFQASELVTDCIEYICLDKGDSEQFDFEVPKGKYNIEVQYQSSNSMIQDDNIEILINGEIQEPGIYTLPRFYMYDGDIKKDRYGNEVLPEQKIDFSLQTQKLKPSGGIQSSNSVFELDGNVSIELKSISNSLVIKKVNLVPAEKSFVYSPVENNGETIILEAEDIYKKNNVAINIKNENNAYVSPTDTKHKQLNVVDGNTFKTAGDQISYLITAPKEGYYNISLKIKNASSNIPVFLNLYVDDVIQEETLNNIQIESSSKYQTITVDKPIYLKAGDSVISLEISANPYQDINTNITNVNEQVQNLKNDIIQITGGVADENRSWQLTTNMPGLEADLTEINDSLVLIEEQLLAINNGETNEYINTLNLMQSNLAELLENIDNIPNHMDLLSDGSTSILSLGIDFKTKLSEQKLSVDKLYFVPNGEELVEEKITSLQNLNFEVIQFFNTFGTKEEEEEMEYTKEIDIWVKRPRQYVDVMQQMVDEQFTPETGIKINFSIMTDQNKITMANAAGEQPDVVMGIDNWYAYDLGLREAFTDVNQFDETDEILSTMAEGATTIIREGDKMYGIPETQDLNVLYYRTDIIEQLGVEVPDTWDDVLSILPLLQAEGMNFYLPFSGGTSLKSYTSTYPFFAQNDLSFYSEDGITTTLDQEENIEVLQFMTDLYTIYGLPANVPNFYDSFREGSIPMGVSGFSTYIQLSHAAPELAGKWSVAVVPGTLQADGTINRSMTGGQTVSSIFEKSTMKSESMEFLEWWNTTQVQTTFEQRLLSTYGPEYLWNSANNEAFANLPLNNNDIDAFSDSFEWVLEPPKTPGGYYLERGISDTWNAVVFEGENLKSVVDEQVDIVNKELAKKYEEFGYIDKDGNVIKPYDIKNREDLTKEIEE